METKAKGVVALVPAQVICQECRMYLDLVREGDKCFYRHNVTFMSPDYPRCKNEGRTFEAPTVELVEVPST